VAKQWIAFVLLGSLLAAAGCEDVGGKISSAGNTSAASAAAEGMSSKAPNAELPQQGRFPEEAVVPSVIPSPEASVRAASGSPPDGSVLTVDKALATAKHLHGNSSEVLQWKAEFQRDVDIEGIKRDVWRVEALFRAGNKWWYWLDAKDGKMLVMSEVEAPSAEQEAEPPFKPYLTQTENGLRLDWDKGLYPDVTIMQTLESPEANKLAVHLVRRLAYVKGRERFLMDAVIVDPAGKSLRPVPLADVTLSADGGMDSYTASSFAVAHGFVHGERLILTMPATRQGKLEYNVLSLQIRTGETSVLVEGFMPNPAPDWVAEGWLNSTRDKLYLSLFQSGELWEADLGTGHVQKSADSFAHQWPFSSLFISPDGDRFIYRSKEGGLGLYTADGKRLAELPGKEGYYARPPVAWSPDGRFFIQETTPDQNEAYILSKGENGFFTFAPKSVLLFDRDGKRVAEAPAEEKESGSYIEFTGWLADGSAAVLHAYKLERQGDVPERVQSAYYLMNTGDAGSLVPLAETNRIEAMERPEAIFSKVDGRLVFIDRSSLCYLAQGEEFSDTGKQAGQGQLILVSTPGQEPIRWTSSYQGESITMFSYFPATKRTIQTRLPGNGPFPMTIGTDYVYDFMEGYLRLE
jgi:Tol biopolymer transport system component